MSEVAPSSSGPIFFHDLKELETFMQEGKADLLNAVFCDPLGLWHHYTYAASQCTTKSLSAGLGFDGSSIPLFSSIDKSDMVMKPDLTAPTWIDPFSHTHKILHVFCNVYYTSGKPFERCSRLLAKRAAKLVKDLGIADEAFFGPEPEFFIFDHVDFAVTPEHVSFSVDGMEGPWNSKKQQSNLGHRRGYKGYYSPANPIDQQFDLRSQMLLTLQSLGITIEKHHHEAAACQGELGIEYDTLVKTADNVMTLKYVVKNAAREAGKTATFMPKPIAADNGSGCHMHQSLWRNGVNLFYDKSGYTQLSQLARYYIGGILFHGRAICAFSNPTTNSYKRLVPGFEAPCCLIYSKGNRSAAIRIPLLEEDDVAGKRFEARFPDPSCNPYLTFSVMLLAGIDGILNEIQPPEPLDVNIFGLSKEERAKIPSLPGSLDEALDALKKDHEFLLRNGVFDKAFITSYIEWKSKEARLVNTTPHPREFELYYQS